MATVSSGSTSERFGFIQRYRELGVKGLCDWLGVSTTGFYDWEKRPPSEHYLHDQRLLKLITKIYWQHQGCYGSPRVYKTLKKQGVRVGEKRVERLMREAGLVGKAAIGLKKKPGLRRFRSSGENLLKDLAAPTSINQVWVGDVTYLKVSGKWRYLATVMDVYSRRILGWSLSKTRSTELTCAALGYALKKRAYPKGVLFHTDRGVEYMGCEYQKLLNNYDFRHSVNRPGCCTDNAFMESFYHTLKGEKIRGKIFRSTSELRRAISNYINKYYNSIRLHTGINDMSPIEYERCLA